MSGIGRIRSAVAALVAGGALLAAPVPSRAIFFTGNFMPESCAGFASSGAHPFFVLEPGHALALEGREAGLLVELAITVLGETLLVDGVETRVVEERETVGGELVEVSRNYFAICNRTNSVFYFGEDVDFYRNGQVVSHEGSWRAGVGGARAGVIMPGQLLLGSRYFQEIAPGVALDQAEVVGLAETLRTPAGEFTGCLKTRESTPLEPGLVEHNFYAPGVGLVRDGILRLVSVTAP